MRLYIEFLGKDYSNLIQCDFVCRGINSPKAYQAHIKELEKKYGSSVDVFDFKNKRKGWPMLGILVKFKNGKIDFTHSYNSAWWRGYLYSVQYIRPSCEHCRFKKIPRVSDIRNIAGAAQHRNRREFLCTGSASALFRATIS
jgi:hypothetical protein